MRSSHGQTNPVNLDSGWTFDYGPFILKSIWMRWCWFLSGLSKVSNGGGWKPNRVEIRPTYRVLSSRRKLAMCWPQGILAQKCQENIKSALHCANLVKVCQIMITLFQKLENRRTIRLIKILELAFCASWIQLISFEAFPGEFGHKIPI